MLATDTPFSLILFGASGHLARLKLYPALYVLALKKRLPKEYAVIGFARTAMDDAAFRDLISSSIRSAMLEVNDAVLCDLLAHCTYHQGQYDDVAAFRSLARKLQPWKRLAYLSIPPEMFPPVLRNICASGVHTHRTVGDFCCIVEKPVGNDLRSAEEIWQLLSACFAEGEIFLLDHYLGKEAVRNIYYLRLANPVLERIFKNTLIHHVEITASEDTGIEGRAGYFDRVGTLRDMVQSHLCEICALLTMRLREEENTFRSSRLSALTELYLPPSTDLDAVILQGQYTQGESPRAMIPGYRQENGVPPDSRTNTYITLALRTRTARWEGVPFFLRTGKRLARKETHISLVFQETSPMKGGTPNRLDIILQGEAGMRLHLQTKMGGTEPAFRPLLLEDPLVCVGDCLPEHGLLLLEAIHGKQQWFLSFDEVRAAWRLIDPLQTHLDAATTPLHPYPAGSAGPRESEEWIARTGAAWLS